MTSTQVNYDQETIELISNGMMYIGKTNLEGTSESTKDRRHIADFITFECDTIPKNPFGIQLDGSVIIKGKVHTLGKDIFADKPDNYMKILTKLREAEGYIPTQETLECEATGQWKISFDDYLKLKEDIIH